VASHGGALDTPASRRLARRTEYAGLWSTRRTNVGRRTDYGGSNAEYAPLETRVSTHKPSCGRVHQHGCFLKQREPCGAIQFVSSCNYSAARRCHGWYDRVCTQSGRRGERHIERRGAATDFRCPSEAAAGPIGSHARRRSFVLRKDVCRSTNGRRHQHGSARRQRRE